MFKKVLRIKGTGIGIFVGKPYHQFIKGLIKFPIDFIRGKRYGYPTCCVLYYCIIQLTELPAGAITQNLFEIENYKQGYANCPSCLTPKKHN